MSNFTVRSLQESYQFSFTLLDAFIDVCPADLWSQKFGGWPIWQQVYHALGAVDFFILQDGQEPTAALAAQGVNPSLTEEPSKTISQSEMKALLIAMKERADDYARQLSDASLAMENSGLTKRMGSPMTHGKTLVMLAGHALYHLGSCDAALRERGMPGVF